MVQRKLNKKKLILFILVLILIICLIIGGFAFYMISPKDKKADMISYEVKSGMTGYMVFEDLESTGIIRNSNFMKLYSKLTGGVNISAGTYNISASMSVPELVKVLNGDSASNREEVKFTFKEGRNIRQLVSDLTSVTDNITEEEIYNTLKDSDFIDELISKYWFLTDEIKSQDIYYPLEGYLYPNTYMIFKDGTFKEVVYKMLDEMDNKLTPLKSSIESSRYSVHELLTLASIVEQEGSLGSDRKGIAGVFTNRLNNGWNLGSCVTTYYGSKVLMGERDLYQAEIYDCTNKYNTRCNSLIGLPIGPICNPGIESIEASLNPTQNDYYYFVSDKDNNTYFSKNYSEHLSTINRLQREGKWYEY